MFLFHYMFSYINQYHLSIVILEHFYKPYQNIHYMRFASVRLASESYCSCRPISSIRTRWTSVPAARCPAACKELRSRFRLVSAVKLPSKPPVLASIIKAPVQGYRAALPLAPRSWDPIEHRLGVDARPDTRSRARPRAARPRPPAPA